MVEKLTVLVLAGLAVATAAFAERQSYERYQSIVDRQMFGPLPPGFDPTKLASEVQKSSVTEKQLTQEEEKLKSSIHFSVINVTPDGATAVGFTDKSDPKAPVHYYLKVGETRNGWKVKEADPAAATMTIAKGDIEVSLKIGGDSTKDAGATTKAAAADPIAGILGKGASRGAQRRMRERLEREEQAKRDAAAAEREAQREAQAAAEKAQREAERAEERQRLQEIADELKRVREKQAAETKKEEPPAAETEE